MNPFDELAKAMQRVVDAGHVWEKTNPIRYKGSPEENLVKEFESILVEYESYESKRKRNNLTRVKNHNMADKKVQEKWDLTVVAAKEAIEKLIDMQDDCQTRYVELTEKQQEGKEGSELGLILDLDLQTVMDTLGDAEECVIP
jgi:hypothetical protein